MGKPEGIIFLPAINGENNLNQNSIAGNINCWIMQCGFVYTFGES